MRKRMKMQELTFWERRGVWNVLKIQGIEGKGLQRRGEEVTRRAQRMMAAAHGAVSVAGAGLRRLGGLGVVVPEGGGDFEDAAEILVFGALAAGPAHLFADAGDALEQ